MPQRDNKSETQVVFLGKLTLSGTTPAASNWVDTRGFNACTLVLKTDTVTDAGTAAGFSTELQEGSTTAAASATAVASAEMIGLESDLTVTTDGLNDTIVGGLGYLGSKRYARFNVTGTALTNATVEVWAILEEPTSEKTTFVGTSVAAT